MTLIDLGEVTEHPATPAIPLDHRRLLRALLAVLTVVGVLALAGSAHGTPLELRPLWTIAFAERDTIALDGGSAYLFRPEESRTSLSAYDLATGEQRWRVAVGDGTNDFAPLPAGAVVLAPVDTVTVAQETAEGDKYFYVSVGTTVALDAATGAELWRVPGAARPSLATGTALVTEYDDRNRVIGLRVVRLRDGAEIWHRTVPPATSMTELPDLEHPETIATIAADGTATIYGFADGKQRRTARLPGIAGDDSAGAIPAGRNLGVVRTLPETSVTTIYSADTLKPLWQAAFVTPCGVLVCSTDPHAGVAGHDPVTGRVVWAVPGVYDGWAVAGDRLIVGSDISNTRMQLLDSRTGKRIGGPFAGAVASSSTTGDDSLLVTRPSTEPVGQLVVTRIDLADGTQTPLGRFGPSGEPTVCFTSPGYLACPRYDRLHVMAAG